MPQWLPAIAIGLALAATAMLLRAGIQLLWPTVVPFGILFPAILLATLLGRWLGGLTCFVAGGVLTWRFVLPGMRAAGFDQADVVPILVLYIFVGGLMLIMTEAYRRAERRLAALRSAQAEAEARRQAMLTQELNHRIKNTLATVQALAAQSFGKADVPADARKQFEARLVALGRAHDLLIRSAWTMADLEDVIGAATEPFGASARFQCSGPPVSLPARAAIALALALHELATNAVKYGALSVEGGRVRLDWGLEGDKLDFCWQELDGPPVAAPTRRGFGSRLLERSLGGELGGRARLEFAPEGLRCTIKAILPPGE